MNKLPNHTALKEWSNVVAALGRGEQVVLIRKGGIADPSFGVDAERFYLYPTYFHQGESEARAEVTVTHWCEVVRTWTADDAEALERLGPQVLLPQETLLARFHFRPDQALYVIGVRTWELARPALVRFHETYGGCKSWISVDDEIDVEGSRPVLAEKELEAKLGEIDALLAAVV
ncbi:MAG TPA: DUF1802 family protein [Thermoanaerobaculia bacterium]|nr:DUF1802 family protein [Thermoanaerobaculia bacterium]